MNNDSNWWMAAGRFGAGGLWIAAALFFASGAQARDPLAQTGGSLLAQGELIRVQAQTCHVECGQALARCERLRERGTHCPREFQFCKERCDGAKAESPATGRERCSASIAARPPQAFARRATRTTAAPAALVPRPAASAANSGRPRQDAAAFGCGVGSKHQERLTRSRPRWCRSWRCRRCGSSTLRRD